MNSMVTLRELLVDTAFVAGGITCLKLAFNKRIAPGSVPNVYLLVLGGAFLVAIPVLHCMLTRENPRIFFSTVVVAIFLSVVLVSILLIVAVLTGLV